MKICRLGRGFCFFGGTSPAAVTTCHKSRIHIKFYGKVHAALPMQDSGTIPFKELSFVKLVLYKWLSLEFIIQLFS